MNIGIIIGSIGYGGAERVSVRLASWLNKCGHSVSFFTTKKAPEKEYSVPESVKRYQSVTDKGKIKLISSLRENIKSDQPDVVIVMGTPMCVYAVPALAGLNIPFVVSERSSPKNAKIKKSTRILSRILMQSADYFIFQTSGAKAFFPPKIQQRSSIIANPLVLEELPESFEGQREKKVVAVGRLIKEKNYPLLIESFEKVINTHKDYRLEIYGDGPEKDNISNLINSKNLDKQIKLMGTCSDVLQRINDAYLFVLSSDLEGMPNSLMEAMALGLACISTDCPCGGPADLIENEVNGILVPVGDSEKLAESINACMNDSLLVKTLGNNASEIKNRLNINIIGNQWLEVINKITNK